VESGPWTDLSDFSGSLVQYPDPGFLNTDRHRFFYKFLHGYGII